MSRNPHTGFSRKLGAVAAAVALTALAGGAGALTMIDSPTAQPSQPGSAMPRTTGLPASFSQIIAEISPAVVNVQVERQVAELSPSNGEFDSMAPQMRRFFERHFDDDRFGGREFRFGPRPPHGPNVTGIGSGFIIDPDGLIVTNDHLVRGADKITVTTESGREYIAEPVGRDPKTDLTLLKIEGDGDLPAVAFAKRDANVGDWVIAIGNPFGLGHTATTGIVSARHRSIGAGPYDDFLQIDAPINRGNSGGPVFNIDGEVVGINTAIFSPNGGSVGIGFAIPASLARDVVAELEDDGTVERGWLGVQIQQVGKDIAASVGLDRAAGAIVASVVDGSPAAEAGLKSGDVILGVNGNAIENMRQLPRVIAALQAGDKAELAVWRDGREIEVTVEIAELQESAAAATGSMPAAESRMLGLELAPLDEEARALYDIDGAVEGVVVTKVKRSSAAAAKGVRSGDVVVTVAGMPVKTPADVASAIKRSGEQKRTAVLVQLERRNSRRLVALPLSEG